VKLRLRSPRQLARNLLRAARRDRDEVEEYLDARPEEWEALVESAPGDAADVLEELSEEAAVDLLADLDPDDAAEILEEIAPSWRRTSSRCSTWRRPPPPSPTWIPSMPPT
jgi:Mg/Co/Ni transporter MgtE